MKSPRPGGRSPLPQEHVTPSASLAASRVPAGSATGVAQAASLRVTVTSAFFRHRGTRVTFHQNQSVSPAEPTRQPAQVARMLALAHHLQRAVERGAAANQAALASELGLTRARLTQVLDLLLLAPDLQEDVLTMEALDGHQPLAERQLRHVLRSESWIEQRAQWASLTHSAQNPERHACRDDAP